MTRSLISAAMVLLIPIAATAQQTPPAGRQTPPGPGAGQQRPVPPAQPAPAQPVVPRTFSAPVGMLFSSVRPERVADFEKLIAYLQDAFTKTTDATIREQAKGWKVFKAAEAGPNGTVVYVFLLDPTVPNADYALGRILADAYPDTAQLQEIWKLYTGSVTSGGSLLNLSPVSPDPSILTEPAKPAQAATPAPAPAGDRGR